MEVCIVAFFFSMPDLCLILENPQNRRKVNELAPEISQRWKSMSEDEQNAIANELIPAIKEQREMNALARRNVPLATFGDAYKTLQNIESEASLNLFTIHFSDIFHSR